MLAGAIKDLVREKFGIKDDDDVIQSRIRDMHKRKVLVGIEPSKTRKDNKRVYAVNKNIEFSYICGPLPSETGSREIPLEIRRHHTIEIQEAIKQWIVYFPEPSTDYPFDQASRYQDDVHKCRNQTLFPDLENHLPEMGYGIWKRMA